MLSNLNQSGQIFRRLFGSCWRESRQYLRLRSLKLPQWLNSSKYSKPLKALAYSGLTIAILLTILLCFALDNTPQAIVLQGLSRDDIQRAKELLHVEPGEFESVKSLSLNQKDLNIAVSYLLDHFVENTTEVSINNNEVLCQIAVFVPKNPWGRYLDFHFGFKHKGDAIVIKSLKIGEISIPDPAANVLVPFIIRHTALNEYWLKLNQYIKNIRITSQTVEISYLGQIVEVAKQLAIRKHRDYPNLYLYQQQINEIVSQHDANWRLSLSEIMQPLFLSALHRSDEAHAITENRTIIIAIASYIYKNDLRKFLPVGLVYSKEYLVFAYKRNDIPQHFIASALLTSVESSLLSQQIGIDKEVGDAQKGSGFSFIDISADRAGIRFGQEAVVSPAQARKFQEKIATIKDYTAFLPDIEGLPEHMDATEFKAKYTDTSSENYQSVIRLIDNRIAALPIYKE